MALAYQEYEAQCNAVEFDDLDEFCKYDGDDHVHFIELAAEFDSPKIFNFCFCEMGYSLYEVEELLMTHDAARCMLAITEDEDQYEIMKAAIKNDAPRIFGEFYPFDPCCEKKIYKHDAVKCLKVAGYRFNAKKAIRYNSAAIMQRHVRPYTPEVRKLYIAACKRGAHGIVRYLEHDLDLQKRAKLCRSADTFVVREIWVEEVGIDALLVINPDHSRADQVGRLRFAEECGADPSVVARLAEEVNPRTPLDILEALD